MTQTGWRGAPEHPRLLMKVIVTTLVAARGLVRLPGC